MDAKGREIANMERNFIYQHLEKYLQVIKAIPEEGVLMSAVILAQSQMSPKVTCSGVNN